LSGFIGLIGLRVLNSKNLIYLFISTPHPTKVLPYTKK
jgi:hypothetical protein